MPETKTKRLVLCSLFTALIAIGAFIQIPVPMMDYFTLQLLFVLLAGMLLGPAGGAASAAVYVAIGLIGVPIFAAGGGIAYVLRPSFGYLLGFIAGAFLSGLICQKLRAERFRQYLAAAFCGMLITYLIGFTYKFFILNFYVGDPTSLWLIVTASLIGVDIPGDILLCFAAALIAARLNPLLNAQPAPTAR